jgi:hypothetical protein
LSILMRDVPGSPLVAMPAAEELDYVPAPFRARNADSVPQAQISARSVAESLGGAGDHNSICKFLVNVGNQRAIV